MSDFKEAWLEKSRIDYFAPFVSLWLACNSWYRSHYSELGVKDRDLINKLKSDFSRRNHLYQRFENCLLGSEKKKRINFKTNLELLYFSLNRANLKPERLIYICSFEYLLTDYDNKSDPNGYVNIIRNPKINKDGSVNKAFKDEVIRLDTEFITSDVKVVFSGVLELIYQIRNMVIHGNIRPEKDEHEVVKYCYLILNDMLKN